MSANHFWTSHYENEQGYGDTLYSWGTVNVVDGRVYIDAVKLDQYLIGHVGQNVALEFVFGLKFLSAESGYGLDEHIAGLVQALQSIGVRTIHSCHGHMRPVDNKFDWRYPLIDFIDADRGKFEKVLPAAWEIINAPYGDPDVSRLRTFLEANNEDELRVLQSGAEIFAGTLSSLLALDERT